MAAKRKFSSGFFPSSKKRYYRKKNAIISAARSRPYAAMGLMPIVSRAQRDPPPMVSSKFRLINRSASAAGTNNVLDLTWANFQVDTNDVLALAYIKVWSVNYRIVRYLLPAASGAWDINVNTKDLNSTDVAPLGFMPSICVTIPRHLQKMSVKNLSDIVIKCTGVYLNESTSVAPIQVFYDIGFYYEAV